MSAEPVVYTVRESTRAKHARLVVSPHRGLVVVVPKGFDKSRIPEILWKKAGWIERVSARLEAQRPLSAGRRAESLPATLSLRAVNEDWHVEYRRTSSPRVTAQSRPCRRLVVSGRVDDTEAVGAALSRWLGRRARETLVPWLEDLAHECGFAHGPVSVRSQRTRWASCSRRKSLSINVRLLFLPEELVTYVFFHELCHTVRMDHSEAFWRLVQKFEPDYRGRKRSLREAWRFVPTWLN